MSHGCPPRLALLSLSVTLVGAACSVEPGEPRGDATDIAYAGVTADEVAQRHDIHRLLDDAEVESTGEASVEEIAEQVARVQSFLDSYGSFLADYVDPAWGKSAATLIVERAEAHGIQPLYMLARIQIESSLIQSGTANKLAQATGCGCPDTGGCSSSYAGFGNQIECGAAKMRNYLDDLDEDNSTVSGWGVDVGRSTSDPCWVIPQNRVTAALYTYTPWVGAYGDQCRKRLDVGGSTLVAVVYDRYQTSLAWTSTAPPTDPPPSDPPPSDAPPSDPPPSDPPPSDPPPSFCAPSKTGLWCVDDDLVECAGGAEVRVTACSDGCEPMPPGTPDRCAPPPPPPPSFCAPSKTGTWCVDDDLVQCAGGSEVSRVACVDGCRSMPAGTPDQCW